ncbi:MAG: GyrI-like domain-containing protein [Ignavibacteria bacterium]|nr:GyrI-like domain-containing protein [Ignavibacteria bacterium]
MNIEELGPFEVAYIHHIGPYKEIGPVFDELASWCSVRGLFGPNTQAIGMLHDMIKPVPPEHLRYDACFVVQDGAVGEGMVNVMTIAVGTYATKIHEGPYSGLTDAFHSLIEEATAAEFTLRDTGCIEIYLDDPSIVPQSEIRTLIGVPVVSEASQGSISSAG